MNYCVKRLLSVSSKKLVQNSRKILMYFGKIRGYSSIIKF
jgi:hypothetical protein